MADKIEYLDPSIAGEGESANNWAPGAWTNMPTTAEDEYQADLEPPHIPDYAMLKKHKHYRQYFRPYRYQPFPAFMYHETLGEKIVKSKEEVAALGPEWSPIPIKPRVDMTGKSLPVKSDTQRLTEIVANGLAAQRSSNSDPALAVALAQLAAVLSAQQQPAAAKAAAPTPETLMPPVETAATDEKLERTALLELAEKEAIKVDGRWSNARIKEALGIN